MFNKSTCFSKKINEQTMKINAIKRKNVLNKRYRFSMKINEQIMKLNKPQQNLNKNHTYQSFSMTISEKSKNVNKIHQKQLILQEITFFQ